MIKGIAGHGFNDTLVVPILENTPHEADLAESMAAAIQAYPATTAVLVRRHGVYVWGSSWESAKTQAECYHYLFELAVRMRGLGFDPSAPPTPGEIVGGGFGAAKAYGSGGERTSTYAGLAALGTGGGGDSNVPSVSPSSDAPPSSLGGSGEAEKEGWHGSNGTSAISPEQLASCEDHSQLPIEALHRPLPSSFTHVILDVEGCTTSLSFVTETLFPYALSSLSSHLDAGWSLSSELDGDVKALITQSEIDCGEGGPQGASNVALNASLIADAWKAGPQSQQYLEHAKPSLLSNVAWLSASGRKVGALKVLQGHIWREGYIKGELAGHVFEDTPLALSAWDGENKKVYIYSSGSREAQRLLFQYSTVGDLRGKLSGYFDTTTGPKLEAKSYKEIIDSIGLGSTPNLALFATDSLAEAKAAREAGLQVVLTVRPGNNALPKGIEGDFPLVNSLLQLTASGGQR